MSNEATTATTPILPNTWDQPEYIKKNLRLFCLSFNQLTQTDSVDAGVESVASSEATSSYKLHDEVHQHNCQRVLEFLREHSDKLCHYNV